MTAELPTIEYEQVAEATQFNDHFEISHHLGIDDDSSHFREKMLVLSFLQQGLSKREVQNSATFAKLGGCSLALPGLKTLATAINRHHREKQRGSSLDLESTTQQYIDLYFQSAESKLRARTIQLAINSLLAEATYQSKEAQPKFNPTTELLDQWGQKWIKLLSD